MKTTFTSLVAGAAMLALAGVANAGEPVALSDSQMDTVSAGALALANAAALAIGNLGADTASATQTLADAANFVAIGQAASASAASSILVWATGSSAAQSAAALP
jgi:hypothetical protein